MTIHIWYEPALKTGRDSGRIGVNQNLENLLTTHSDTGAPPVMRRHMMQVRENGGGAGIHQLWCRNFANGAWVVLGDVSAANFGKVNSDGTNPWLADLDADGFTVKDIVNATPSAAPSGTPPIRFGFKVGATTYWVPGYGAF